MKENFKKTLLKILSKHVYGGGLLFLISLSLISGGFASFLIGYDDNFVKYSENINVGGVEGFIAFDTSIYPSGYSCFSFCDEGFVSNSEIVDTGTLTFYLQINMRFAEQNGLFTNDKQTIFQSSLSLNETNHFNNSSQIVLNSVTFRILSGTSTIAPLGNVDIDKNNDTINETIQSTFAISNILNENDIAKAELSYVFNSNLLKIGNGFDSTNVPSFNLNLVVTAE